MATEDVYCEAHVILKMYNERIGKISYTRRLWDPTTANAINNTSNVSTANFIVANSSTSAVSQQLGAPSEWIDPMNPDLKLTYEWNGGSIPRNEVLSALLDAMVIVAKNAIDQFESLEAHSTPDNCILLLDRSPRAKGPLRCAPKVGRVMLLLGEHIFRPNDRWGDMTFDVRWDNELLVFGLVGNLNPWLAVAAA